MFKDPKTGNIVITELFSGRNFNFEYWSRLVNYCNRWRNHN